MGTLARIERFLERALERPSARLFRARIRPVQVLRRVERAMEAATASEHGRTSVPEDLAVRLHPHDLATLGSPDELAAYLADGALAFARAHGYRLAERPGVRIHADPRVEPGDPVVTASRGRVDGRLDGASGAHALGAAPGASDVPAPEGTRAFHVPEVRAPSAILEVRPLGRTPRTVELGPAPTTIGRSADNTVVLEGGAVSRHHARIQARGGALVLTDLGSTNGTLVNGTRVREIVLGDGDDVTIGDTVLTVRAGSPGRAHPEAAPWRDPGAQAGHG